MNGKRLELLALEINAVLHCNLSCRGCSHASPVMPKMFADPVTVQRDLSALAPVVEVEELRVLGGEPLLHPQLPDVLDAVRASGVIGRIRVITNGTRLHLTDWGWVEHTDEVHVSRYPGTMVRHEALSELERRCREGGKDLVVKDYESFRLVHPSRPLEDKTAQEVFETCQDAHAWSCHTVQEGALYMCPPTAPPAETSWNERCDLEPASTLRERLEVFLHRTERLSACTNCLGTVGGLVPHRQVRRGRWHETSHEGEIDRAHMEAIRQDKWADIGCSTDRVLVETEKGLGALA